MHIHVQVHKILFSFDQNIYKYYKKSNEQELYTDLSRCLLPQSHPNANQIFTPFQLITRNSLHPRLPSTNEQPTVPIPCPPFRTPGVSMGIRIESLDKTSPIPLHNWDDRSIGATVGRRDISRRYIIRTPDSIDVDHVWDANAGFLHVRILHGILVVPAGGAGFGEDRGHGHARAGVAHVTVGVACGSPVRACVWEVLCLVFLEVPFVDFGELVEFDFGELVLDEGVGFANLGYVFGGENASFVGDVAEDDGDFEEVTLLEETVGVIWD